MSVWMMRIAAFCSSYCESGAEPRCLASFQHRLQLGKVWVRCLGCSIEGRYYSEGRTGSCLVSWSCFVHEVHTGSVPQRHMHTTQSLPNTTNKRPRPMSKMFLGKAADIPNSKGLATATNFLHWPLRLGPSGIFQQTAESTNCWIKHEIGDSTNTWAVASLLSNPFGNTMTSYCMLNFFFF